MPADLEDAIRLIKSGDRESGRQLLAGILAREPGNETAWLWMAGAVDDDEQRRYCLSRALEINPEHVLAREVLAQLQPQPPAPGPEAPEPQAAGPLATAPKAGGPVSDGPNAGSPKSGWAEASGMAVAQPQPAEAGGRRRLALLFLGAVLLLAGMGLAVGAALSLAGLAPQPMAYAAVALDVLRWFAILVSGLACLVTGAWALWRAVWPADEEGQR
jgi:hypothetical protein